MKGEPERLTERIKRKMNLEADLGALFSADHDCEKQVSDKNPNPLSSEVIGIEDQIIIVFENIAMFRF